MQHPELRPGARGQPRRPGPVRSRLPSRPAGRLPAAAPVRRGPLPAPERVVPSHQGRDRPRGAARSPALLLPGAQAHPAAARGVRRGGADPGPGLALHPGARHQRRTRPHPAAQAGTARLHAAVPGLDGAAGPSDGRRTRHGPARRGRAGLPGRLRRAAAGVGHLAGARAARIAPHRHPPVVGGRGRLDRWSAGHGGLDRPRAHLAALSADHGRRDRAGPPGAQGGPAVHLGCRRRITPGRTRSRFR